jgi:hypothetical protein
LTDSERIKRSLAFIPDDESISKYDDKLSIFGTIPPAMPVGGYDEVWDQYDMDTSKYAKDTEDLAVYKMKQEVCLKFFDFGNMN